jgi:hypothetical protein
VPIVISPPLEFVPEYVPLLTYQLAWRFPHTTPSQFRELLVRIGLPDALQATLISQAESDPAINGLTVHPSRDLVLGLSAEHRSALYAALSAYAENVDQQNAFRFCGSSLDQWFDQQPVSPQIKALIEPLLYRHGRYLFFADLRSIEEWLPSLEERALLIKALSRDATFLARLKLNRDSDIEALVNYWGRGGRAKDVRPILESLASIAGGESINIAQLLPPFARVRLYTYPVPSEKASASEHDCHWTSLNFFAEEPEERFGEPAAVARTLEDDYYRVYGNLQLGDLVFYSDAVSAVHSAVYLADDILFTKNGNTSSRPWMLVKLEDMQDFYPALKPLEVRYYRRKDL